ncbi:MAG: hypothetical protein J6S54_00215 [Lentisphaeria bacterium]|nr:hypothetical protein [Lentisphaeria bacterium]
MDDSTFTTSIPARKAAVCIINAARERGYINGPLITAPELGEIEKQLFMKMFAALPGSDRITNCSLETEQMSSLFTFVFAKAAETAAQLYEGVEKVELETDGMFSLSVPIAAGELLNSYSADLDFPTVCLERFLELSEEEDFSEPFYSLFEALKWCFRISFHIFWDYLEQQS